MQDHRRGGTHFAMHGPRGIWFLLVALAAGCSSEGDDADPSWWSNAGSAGASGSSAGGSDTGGSDTGGSGADTGGSGGQTGGSGGGASGASGVGGSTASTGGSGGGSSDAYEAERLEVLARINELRAGKSLPPFERWVEAEACADLQAEDDSITGIPHNAWKTGKFNCPGGASQNECPGWGGPGCVDAMWSEGDHPDCANCDFCPGDNGCDGCDFFGTTTGTTCGHYENLSAKGYTKVAVGFGGGWMLINFN